MIQRERFMFLTTQGPPCRKLICGSHRPTPALDGPLIGVGSAAAVLTGNVLDEVLTTFHFPSPAVSPGGIVTFEIGQVSGPIGALFAIQNEEGCPVIETNDATPPLSTFRRNGIAVRIFEQSPCNLQASYEGDTLTLDFQLSTAEPTTWNAWMSVQTFTFPLWSIALPPIELSTPISIPGFPQLGSIGVLTTLTTAGEGIVCSDWEAVDTGTPAIVSSAQELKELLRR